MFQSYKKKKKIILSKIISNLGSSMKKKLVIKPNFLPWPYPFHQSPKWHFQDQVNEWTWLWHWLHWWQDFTCNSRPSNMPRATEGSDTWTGALHCYYWWMDLKPPLQEIQYLSRFRHAQTFLKTKFKVYK